MFELFVVFQYYIFTSSDVISVFAYSSEFPVLEFYDSHLFFVSCFINFPIFEYAKFFDENSLRCFLLNIYFRRQSYLMISEKTLRYKCMLIYVTTLILAFFYAHHFNFTGRLDKIRVNSHIDCEVWKVRSTWYNVELIWWYSLRVTLNEAFDAIKKITIVVFPPLILCLSPFCLLLL